MTRLTITLAAAGAMAAGLAALPMPAAAQAGQTSIIIFGDDPCPREYICIRKREGDRYRLPKAEQLQGTLQQRQSWSKQAQALTTVGSTGAGSCSAVGPGGFTGCLTQQINQARKESREQQQSDQSPER